MAQQSDFNALFSQKVQVQSKKGTQTALLKTAFQLTNEQLQGCSMDKLF